MSKAAFFFLLAAFFAPQWAAAAPAARDPERELYKDSLIQKGMSDEEIELRLRKYDAQAASRAKARGKSKKGVKAKPKLRKAGPADAPGASRPAQVIPRLKVDQSDGMSRGSRGERSVNAKDELPKFRKPGEKAPPPGSSEAEDAKKAEEMMKGLTPEQRLKLEKMMQQSEKEDREYEAEEARKASKGRKKTR